MYEKLITVQKALNAPKSRYNGFGKYSYRSCEDILEALKPLLSENELLLTLNDEIVMIGERYYCKATATITNANEDWSKSAVAFAREDDEQKGMTGAQLTGSVSSYARKYALNALFLIDDNKDPDTDEYAETKNKAASKAKKGPKAASDSVKKAFVALCKTIGQDPIKILGQAGWKEGDVCTDEILEKANIIVQEIQSVNEG